MKTSVAFGETKHPRDQPGVLSANRPLIRHDCQALVAYYLLLPAAFLARAASFASPSEDLSVAAWSLSPAIRFLVLVSFAVRAAIEAMVYPGGERASKRDIHELSTPFLVLRRGGTPCG